MREDMNGIEQAVATVSADALMAKGFTSFRLVNPSDETRDLIIANGGSFHAAYTASLRGFDDVDINRVDIPQAWDIYAGTTELRRVLSILKIKTCMYILSPAHFSLLFPKVSDNDRVRFIVPDKAGMQAIVEKSDCERIETLALPCRSDMLELSDVLLLTVLTSFCNGCGEVQYLHHLTTIGTQQVCYPCATQLDRFEIGTLITAIEQVTATPDVVLIQTEHLGLDALCAYFDDAAYDDGSGEHPEPQYWRWCDAIADTAIPEQTLKDFITFVEKHGWEHYTVSEQDAEGFHLFSIATQRLGYRDTPVVPPYPADTPEDEIPF